MPLRAYFEIFRRRRLILLIVVLLAVGGSAAITMAVTPQFTATTRLFFAVQGGESVSDLAQGSTYAEKQMTSYSQVATSPLVLDPVIERLNLEVDAARLAESVSASVPPETVIVQITATDASAARAAAIANGVGAELSKVAADLSPERPDGTEAVRATTLASAQTPTEASSPNVLRNLAIGLVLGLIAGGAVAVSRHILDTKIRSELDLHALTTAAMLGLVPYDSGAIEHVVVMRDDPLGARSEAMRRLRTNLQFVQATGAIKSIVVTSSIPGEGKTTTTINLAVALADAGTSVVLVDADLRRPSVAEYLGLEGSVGLTTVLIGRAELDDVVQPRRDSSLDISCAGQIPPNPSELLGSSSMSSLLEELTTKYDVVLLDSSPLLPVTDAAILSKSAGGTLVVVGADRTHSPQLREALESLETVDANLLGVVLNKVERRDASSYVYNADYAAAHSAEKALNIDPALQYPISATVPRRAEAATTVPASAPSRT